MKIKILMFSLGVIFVTGVIVFTQKDGEITEHQPAIINSVSLPQEEDMIRVFFSLIDEGKVSEAVMMMAPIAIKDDNQKQAWGVMWNEFEEIKVLSVVAEEDNLYKVVLKTKMKTDSEDIAPMPYYGYGNGEFTRWVETEMVEGVLKIRGIATGP